MIIKNEKPQIWDAIIAAGMSPNEETTVVTYGDTLYVPSGKDVPLELMAHEEKHSEQQLSIGVDRWWSRYLKDPYFRCDQESEAYAVQYDYVCRMTKNRGHRFAYLLQLARILSSPTYGGIITNSAALTMIRQKAKTK